ncbi:MAG TPA: lysophospholipase [Stellaceae bacterium]|nr:lysophospholipase [Stellaceae bacterium]
MKIERTLRIIRTFVTVGLLGGLAACAPNFQDSPNAFNPTAEQQASLVMPRLRQPTLSHLTNGAMIADDGKRLPMQVWLPHDANGDVTKPKAVIVALHGFNDYSHAFAMPASIWQARGIATYAYDQRGFGANDNAGIWPGSESLCRDLGTALNLVQAQWPGVPVYALGESMGGAVILDAEGGSCSPHIHPAGIILAAPAVWARSTMPWPNRVALWLGGRVLPWLHLTGRGLHIRPSNNIPMLIQLSRDPLTIKKTRADAVYGLVDLMDAAYQARPNPTIPTLLLYGAHDQLVPPRPTHDVAQRLAQAQSAAGNGQDNLRTAYYAHGYHMLLRDLDYRLVAGDVADWILNKNAPLSPEAQKGAAQFFKMPASALSSKGVEPAPGLRQGPPVQQSGTLPAVMHP